MSGEDDDIDVDAILARAAALREKAAAFDLEADAPPSDPVEPPSPKVSDSPEPPRSTLVPAPSMDPPPPSDENPFDAVASVLDDAARARGVEPQPDTGTSDPFEAAHQALERAEQARGVDRPQLDPFEHVGDPMSAARAALESAKAARTNRPDPANLDAALARAQLRRLKRESDD